MGDETKRGFAAWDKDKLRETAAKGGRTVHAKGTGHRFTKEEAQAAGRKGGLTSAKRAADRRAYEGLRGA